MAIDLVTNPDLKLEKQYNHAARKHGKLVLEGWVKVGYGPGTAYVWEQAAPLYDNNGHPAGAIESLRDITAYKKAVAAAETSEDAFKKLFCYRPNSKERYFKDGTCSKFNLIRYDLLTGLYNRAFFEAEMKRIELGDFDAIAVIVCDIDGLKWVNDTLGHETGDKMLIAASVIIKECFRDQAIARLGGSEFAIIWLNPDIRVLEQSIQKMRRKITEYASSHSGFPLSLSAGYAISDAGAVHVDELFKKADYYMYREKLNCTRSARSAIVKTLAKALEARDSVTERHAQRLQSMVLAISREIGMDEQAVHDLRLFSQFHDIGKIGVPDRILFKPGLLTPKEREEMQRHCEIGYHIALAAPDMVPIADMILKHHEWWNGQGYPLGLKEQEIPLECRILSVVDAYDAITNDRPYRRRRTHTEAVQELIKYSGTQFDPYIVENFIKISNRI